MNVSRENLLMWALDAAGVLGVASISYGAWLVYQPAGFIVGGALILAGVVAIARGGI